MKLNTPNNCTAENDDDDDGHVQGHTRRLCREIKTLFHHRRRQYDTSSSVAPTTNSDAKRKIIEETARWIDFLMNQRARSSSVIRKLTFIDALVSLLRSIDDVDIENLQFLSSRWSGATKEQKRVNDQVMNQCPSEDSALNKRGRRRLPPNVRSMDVVRAMHDAEAAVTHSDDDDDVDAGNVPKLYISNYDRSKRAKKTHMERQHGCSTMGISMKDVMKAQMPNVDTSQMPISTLTHDAAVLRRDLYKIIAECDTDEIKMIVGGEGGSSKNDKLRPKVHQLISTLLSRITAYPNSPSLRLSAMVALDYIRELGLSDWGYRCVLDTLLEIRDSWSLRFYAEIVSECHTYENPVRLLGISKLLKQALDTTTPTLLRAVSHIMVRRRNLLSSLDQEVEHRSPQFKREYGLYKRMCDSMSIRFGSTSDWLLPSMSSDVRESVISALRAVGILSFFSCDEGISHNSPESSQTVDTYPFSICFSLRSAHDRLGPCDGFNRLISHPESYDQIIMTPHYVRQTFIPSLEEEEDVPGPFLGASEDILIIVFSFLGFRSLMRVSQCCTSWAQAYNAATPILWRNLYFKKYKNSRFEEEMAHPLIVGKNPYRIAYLANNPTSIVNPYLQQFLSINSVTDRQQVATSIDGYDWKRLFANKYATEKRSKGETCSIIGCCYVRRRLDHMNSHMKR